MINKKTVRWILWFCMLLLFVKLLMLSLYNGYFIEQSVLAKARVISVVKNNQLYDTTLRFVTKHDTLIEAELKLLTEHQPGQIVSVRYNPVIPAQLTKDTFIEIWFNSLLTAGLLLSVALMLYLISVCSCWIANRGKRLSRGGDRIYTQFDTVERVVKAKKEGKYPYQIITSWHDGAKNKTYYFKSKYIWHNPVDYILDQTITVFIYNKNKKSMRWI